MVHSSQGIKAEQKKPLCPKIFFWRKKSRTVMLTVKKSKCLRVEISQKFQWILIQQAKSNFSE
jgi:hypothetical protein